MSKKQPKKTVKVVVAPSSFPDFSQFDSSSSRKSKKIITNYDNAMRTKKTGGFLDFDETVREVYDLGSTRFAGKQKRDYEDEQYTTLTGQHRKKQKIPLKVVRGIKKAAIYREARVNKETKEAGIVTANKRGATKKNYSEKVRKASQLHGPAPSIGYLKKGVLTVKR